MKAYETCLLQISQAQLLLYGMGVRRIYGFVQQTEPSREEALQLYMEMVRNGILIPEQDTLALQEPWRNCLAQWSQADTVVRFHAAGDSRPDACLYPGIEQVLAVTPQQRRPAMLRLTALPRDGVWPWLAEEYDLPPESRDTLLCEQASLAGAEKTKGTLPAELPGLLFLLEAVGADGSAAARLAAVQHPLYRQLLCERDGCVTQRPYRTAELQSWLQPWFAPKKEKTL